jgi:hypothetical protein
VFLAVMVRTSISGDPSMPGPKATRPVSPVLAGRAAEAQAKAERLRAFAAPGGLQSDELTRVVDEQAGLPDAVLEPSAA